MSHARAMTFTDLCLSEAFEVLRLACGGHGNAAQAVGYSSRQYQRFRLDECPMPKRAAQVIKTTAAGYLRTEPDLLERVRKELKCA